MKKDDQFWRKTEDEPEEDGKYLCIVNGTYQIINARIDYFETVMSLGNGEKTPGMKPRVIWVCPKEWSRPSHWMPLPLIPE